jgi:hypothetical protein
VLANMGKGVLTSLDKGFAVISVELLKVRGKVGAVGMYVTAWRSRFLKSDMSQTLCYAMRGRVK